MDHVFLQSNANESTNQQLSTPMYRLPTLGLKQAIVATGHIGRLSPLLSKVVLRGCNSLHCIAQKHNIRVDSISKVMHGREKSRRVEAIIQESWGISVAEFQELTREWMERRTQGRGYSEDEIQAYGEFVRARKLGISVEELHIRTAPLVESIKSLMI